MTMKLSDEMLAGFREPDFGDAEPTDITSADEAEAWFRQHLGFRHVRIRGVDLSNRVLEHGVITCFEMRDGSLARASLKGCRLANVTLHDVVLRETDLSGCLLQGRLEIAGESSLVDATATSFEKAFAAGVAFVRLRLARACFDAAMLEGASFDGCQARQATFVGANMTQHEGLIAGDRRLRRRRCGGQLSRSSRGGEQQHTAENGGSRATIPLCKVHGDCH